MYTEARVYVSLISLAWSIHYFYRMPQVFMVVRCYACNVFQVQQVKKVPKWVCKMCGEKQSLKKEYGRGSGADCRRHVQKLNMLKASLDNDAPVTHPAQDAEASRMRRDEDYSAQEYYAIQPEETFGMNAPKDSTWRKFIMNPEDEAHDELEPQSYNEFDANMITTDRDALTSKRKRGGKRGSSNWSGSRMRKFDKNANAEESFRHQQSHTLYSPPDGRNDEYSSSRAVAENNWRGMKQQTVQSESRPFPVSMATKKLPGDRHTPAPYKANGRWDNIIDKPTCFEDDETDIELTRKKTIKPTPSRQSSSTTTSTSGKWGQFLDNAAECLEESSEESLQDHFHQSSLLSQDLEQESCNQDSLNKEWTTSENYNDNYLMPDDSSQNSSCQSFHENFTEPAPQQVPMLKTGTIDSTGQQKAEFLQNSSRWNVFMSSQSKQTETPERKLIDGEQKVDSLQGSSRWNATLSKQSNRSHLDKALKQTDHDFALDQSHLTKTSNTDRVNTSRQIPTSCCKHENASRNTSTVQSQIAGTLFSLEEHDLNEIFSDDW